MAVGVMRCHTNLQFGGCVILRYQRGLHMPATSKAMSRSDESTQEGGPVKPRLAGLWVQQLHHFLPVIADFLAPRSFLVRFLRSFMFFRDRCTLVSSPFCEAAAAMTTFPSMRYVSV